MHRFTSPKKEKINALVKRSHARHMPNFTKLLQEGTVSSKERHFLQALLEKYQSEGADVHADLQTLTTITSEVHGINNQAVMLHGERIKCAHTLFKNYREGAFSTWLIRTYGNRQTPYNFMQYFELYTALPQKLQKILDTMPRQVIYSLSSRSVSQEKKEAFIRNYRGETKSELLEKLRQIFPLEHRDKRNSNRTKKAQDHLKEAYKAMKDPLFSPTGQEKFVCQQLLRQMQSILKKFREM